MDQIFKNSLLTIVASRSRKASDGFLDNYMPCSTAFYFPVLHASGTLVTVTLQKVPDIHYADEPINMRAWTLQEHLLSPRTLSFLSKGATLEWQCESAWESNIGPIEKPFGEKLRLYSQIFPRRGSAPLPLARHRLCHLWAGIVEDYSARDLTYSEDKLLAISAVAQEFARIFGTGYYAGLWRSILVPQLLWKSVYPLSKPNTRADTYRSPSWSWASIVGRVDLCPFPCLSDSKLNVLDCKVALADNNAPFGAVASAILTVQGALKKATVHICTLYDSVTGEVLALASLDTRVSIGHNPVWCLLVTTESSVDWDVETLTSQTSQDYPDTLCALLLTKAQSNQKVAFQRVGITDEFPEPNLHWFDDATVKVIDII